jgi:hypothetical protein
MPPVSTQWLPSPEAADYLGVSKDTLRRRRDTAGGYLVNGKHWRYAGDSCNSKIIWAVDLIAAEFNKRGLRAAQAGVALRALRLREKA